MHWLMLQQRFYPAILFLSLPLISLLIYTSWTGIFTAGFYLRETLNWQVQSIGQDMVDLYIIVPCLILSTFFAWKGSRTGLLIWGGVNLYLVIPFVYSVLMFALIHFFSFIASTSVYHFIPSFILSFYK